MRFTASMPTSLTPPNRLSRVLVGALVVLGSSSVAGVAAEPGPHDRTSGRPGPCGEASADPADFPRVVPLPRGDYTIRGYLRVDCRQVLDLALETDDLKPEQRHLVRRFRAKGFRGVTWTSRTVEVPTGPETEPERREEFVVHVRGHGHRVTVDLSFVGVAPRWSGTALVRYVVRPLR